MALCKPKQATDRWITRDVSLHLIELGKDSFTLKQLLTRFQLIFLQFSKFSLIALTHSFPSDKEKSVFKAIYLFRITGATIASVIFLHTSRCQFLYSVFFNSFQSLLNHFSYF